MSAEPEIILVASIWSEKTAELWPSNVLTGVTVCRKSHSYARHATSKSRRNDEVSQEVRSVDAVRASTKSIRSSMSTHFDHRVVRARDDALVEVVVDAHDSTAMAEQRRDARALAAVPDLD